MLQGSQNRLDLLLEAAGDGGPILILPHNDPDPDAIASAVALGQLLVQLRQIESDIAYKGIVGRAENRALLRYLGNPLRPLTAGDLSGEMPMALVDTQPGTGNNALAAGSEVAIVIDHHPWRGQAAPTGYVDIRPEAGATSTILTEYLQAAGLEPEPPLATALFYGIKTDTRGLSRGVSAADAAAYFYLQPRVDTQALGEIENAQVPADYFRSLGATLRAARMYDGLIIAYIGALTYPDLAAELADVLLRLENVQWVFCMGVYEDTLILSVRTQSPAGGAGALVQAIVGDEGSAGGHGLMAGGQVRLEGRDPEQVAHSMRQRALGALRLPPEAEAEGLI